MTKNNSASIARVRALFTYDPETGILSRKDSGRPVGNSNGLGYLQVQIDGHAYTVHRVIWFLVIGAWPRHEIDHRDGDGSNNRWCNLREATRTENQVNSASRHALPKGVYPHRRKWRASISANGRRRYLGLFASVEAAAEAFAREAVKLHGDFVHPSVRAVLKDDPPGTEAA